VHQYHIIRRQIIGAKESTCHFHKKSEITFFRWIPILFVVFMGRLIHKIKNPMNNETWEAVGHQYVAIYCPGDLSYCQKKS
jgi:hypothetical protein